MQRESPLVSVIELHWNGTGLEADAEPHYIKRTISPFEIMDKRSQQGLLNSLDYISWHPKQTERVIMLSNTNLLCDFKIPERVSISFDNNNKLWSSIGNVIKDLTVSVINIKLIVTIFNNSTSTVGFFIPAYNTN